MNSMPAASRARRMAKSFATVIEVSSSVSSARRIVVTPTEDSRARSSALHRISARAALIWALISDLDFMLTIYVHMIYFIPFGINKTTRLKTSRIRLKPGERHEIAVVDKGG
jgi:hypothetical protein